MFVNYIRRIFTQPLNLCGLILRSLWTFWSVKVVVA